MVTNESASVSQLAQMIVNCGAVGAVVDYLGNCHGNLRLPGIMMLGYVAAHGENLAMAVILSKVGIPLQAQFIGHVEGTSPIMPCVTLSCRVCPSWPSACRRSVSLTSRRPQPGPSARSVITPLSTPRQWRPPTSWPNCWNSTWTPAAQRTCRPK